MGGVRLQGDRVICRFSREEQGRQPVYQKHLNEPRKGHGTSFQLTVHDVFRMPIHHRVRQVETLDVCSCRSLHLLWEAEVAAKLNHFSQVVSD